MEGCMVKSEEVILALRIWEIKLIFNKNKRGLSTVLRQNLSANNIIYYCKQHEKYISLVIIIWYPLISYYFFFWKAISYYIIKEKWTLKNHLRIITSLNRNPNSVFDFDIIWWFYIHRRSALHHCSPKHL